MSIYSFSFTTFIANMLPPRKRVAIMKAWLRVLLSPLEWIYTLVFTDYKDGNSYTDYSLVATYVVGDKVKWTNGSTYICTATTTAGILPSDTDYWYLIADEYMGASIRANYTGQKLLLEYALNKNYSTAFNQPPTPSDIYVTTSSIDVNTFTVGTDASDTSSAAISGSYAVDFVGTSYTYDTTSLTINVPNATLSTLVTGDVNPYPKGKQAVLTYAEKLIFAGITAEVVGY